MKILELALTAFGPFTDTVLDLSAGREGLHLVYGPNEAGKSSALRALRQALFGIPARSVDGFVHRNSELRIGLTLRGGNGQTLRFVRRKGNRNTFLAADGTTLADGAIEQFLGGLTEAEFSRRFAIDHAELVQGGKSILQGGGELGTLLFQAGGGLKNLLDVQHQLKRDFEALFQPRGKNARINATLSELKVAGDVKRRESLPSAEWAVHERAWREAVQTIATIDHRLAAKHAEKRRLERLSGASPLFAQRAKAEGERASLGNVMILSDQFSKTRLEAQTRREAARIAGEHARESLAELDHQITECVPCEPLLAEAEAIEHLRESLAAERKARKALPAEEANQFLALTAACELIADWWPHLLEKPEGLQSPVLAQEHVRKPGLDIRLELVLKAGDQLRLSRAQKIAIQSLSSERARLVAEHEETLGRFSKLTSQARDAQAQLEMLAPVVEIGPLELTLAQARNLGDLDQALQSAQGLVTGLENEAARTLRQLPCWSGTLDALQTISVPTSETIDRFESEFSGVSKEAERLRDDRRDTVTEQVEAEAALEQLHQGAGGVPTEEDLMRMREHRDELWRLIRQAWENNQIPAEDEISKNMQVGEADPKGALADGYERLKDQADSCSDRLRREAGRVAQRASALANLHRAKERLRFLDDQEKELAEQTSKLNAEWVATWASTGFEPLSPREMRGWLQMRKELIKQAAELEDNRAELATLERTHALHCRNLCESLLALGDTPYPADNSLSGLRSRAEALLKRLTEVESRRERLSEAWSTLREQAEAAEAQVHSLAERIDAWRERWKSATVPLGLSAEVSIDEAGEIVGAATELQSKIKELRDARARIGVFKQETAQFSQEVQSLCQRAAPDLKADGSPGSLSVEAAAQELLRRFREAQETWNTRHALIQQHEAQLASLKQAERTREEAELQLAALCREAQCTCVDDLPVLEQRSGQARQLQDRLKLLDDQIQQLCGNEPPDAFRQAALAVDLDALPDQLAALTAEIAELDLARDELNQTLGREQQILRQMDGSSRAAEAAELAEELKARLVFDVEEYARLRLASVILEEAIERYRQRSQGAVLSRAADLFARLTLGSFHDLRVAYDDRDQPVLQAVRPGGTETVGIEGLSEGSVDQLYLALRLASLETYLENHEPIPLVADDILIQFDDSRATAALQALGELSRRTQVVLFTHHEHVRGLAESCIDPEVLFVHCLPGRKVGARTTTNKPVSK